MHDEIDICECSQSHCDIIDKVKKEMPDEEKLYDLAELYKVFGDSTRIRILYALLNRRCVCAI